jgi:hypothetical protein
MTYRRALQILIEHTGRDLTGAGVGLRQIASANERKEAIEAILKVWPKVYQFEPDGLQWGFLRESCTPRPDAR